MWCWSEGCRVHRGGFVWHCGYATDMQGRQTELEFSASPHLAKVSRVVFVEQYSMMMLSTSISATSWMLSVLANTTVPGTDVTPLFPGLLEICAAQKGVRGRDHSRSKAFKPSCQCGNQTVLSEAHDRV